MKLFTLYHINTMTEGEFCQLENVLRKELVTDML